MEREIEWMEWRVRMWIFFSHFFSFRYGLMIFPTLTFLYIYFNSILPNVKKIYINCNNKTKTSRLKCFYSLKFKVNFCHVIAFYFISKLNHLNRALVVILGIQICRQSLTFYNFFYFPFLYPFCVFTYI